MKKIKLIKENELSVTIDKSIGCDFCGETSLKGDLKVFTSSYSDCDFCECEPQICFNCVKQLSILMK